MILRKHVVTGTLASITLNVPDPPGKEDGDPGPSQFLIHKIRGTLACANNAVVSITAQWLDGDAAVIQQMRLGTVTNSTGASAPTAFAFEDLALPSPVGSWSTFAIVATSSGSAVAHSAALSSHMFIELTYCNFPTG